MSPAPTQPSATPRTLEAAGYPNNDWHSTADRLFIEAQKLETELAEAREDAKITSLIVGKAHSDIIGLNAELARLRADLAAARKDSERFNLLASMLEDVNIGDINPTKHCTDENDWPDAWRDAIDDTTTNSNHKST